MDAFGWATCVCVCLCAVVTAHTLPDRKSLRDNHGDTGPIPIEEFVKQFGYSMESHQITTEDGYILTYHRIPRSSNSTGSRRGPVLLQHGLLCTSPIWVMSPEALAFELADAGFDVWLGNARGNTYSRRHVSYDPDIDLKEFWDYSWHEMGYYDLPASIDYILQQTGRDQLFYIGHSMGTTMYFVLGATRPEYMAKVKAAVLLAPVAYPYHIRQEEFLTFIQPVLIWLLRNKYEIFPQSPDWYWLEEHVCSNPLLQVICRDIMFSCSGYDEAQLNRTLLPTILQYLPGGVSRKELTHYGQVIHEDQGFRQFDYGLQANLWRYGTPRPPVYNLSLATAPLYMYYGQNDWVAVPQDVLYAASQLPNVKRLVKVPYERFNHVDFLWAIDAKSLLYDDVIASLLALQQEA